MYKIILNYIHFIKSQLLITKAKTSFLNRVKIISASFFKIFLKPLQLLDKDFYFKIRYPVIYFFYKDLIIRLDNKKFKVRDDIDLMTILTDEKIDHIFKEKGKILLDIGAHIGKYSILYSDFYDKIYAFEPEPDKFEYLKKNVKLNNLENKVMPLNLSVADKNEFMDFFYFSIFSYAFFS